MGLKIKGLSYHGNIWVNAQGGSVNEFTLQPIESFPRYKFIDQSYFDDMDRLFARKPKPKRKKKPKGKLRTILNKANDTRNNSR